MSEDLEVLEADQAKAARERLEANLTTVKSVWNYTEKGIEAKRAAMTMLSTKTGMYANVPLTCKADGCPYSDSCVLLPYDLAPIGEFCPVETAQIELRYGGYRDDFDLDHASFTDSCLIAEIINCDIMLERCKALLAKEGVPVISVITGMNEKGETWERPEVSKYWEAYEKTLRRRNEMYQLMSATRADKKKNDGDTQKSFTEIIAEVVTSGQLEEGKGS